MVDAHILRWPCIYRSSARAKGGATCVTPASLQAFRHVDPIASG